MDSAAAANGSGKKKRRRRRTTEVKMEFVSTADGFGNPYVAFFPSGFDPLQDPHDEEGGAGAEFAPYRNPKPNSRQQELTVLREDGADFVGRNYRGEAAGWQPCDYLLGVFDKEKGSLQLMPLAGEKLFRMEARVKGMEYERPADEKTAEVEDAALDEKKSRQMLTQAFGSRKRRMKEERYERARVKEAADGELNSIETLFQEAALKNELAKQTMENANMEVVRNIPPHDIAATTPQNAYQLDKMITAEEWEALAEDADELKSAASASGPAPSRLQKETNPVFVQSRLERLKTKGDADGNERRARVLAYLKHLLAFHCAPPRLIKKAADPWSTNAESNSVNLTQELGIPGVIVARFLKMFTTGAAGGAKDREAFHKTTERTQLAISYVLVLGLMVDDFRADPFDLATELKMTVTQLRPHYEQLGCKFERQRAADKLQAGDDFQSGKMKWKVTLPIPLQFPQITNTFKKKR